MLAARLHIVPAMDERRRRGGTEAVSVLGLLLVAALLCAMPVVAEAADPQETELSCLAHTLYWEAKTEGRNGMVAVGWVILNRMRDGEYPRSVCGVVKQGREKPGLSVLVLVRRQARHAETRRGLGARSGGREGDAVEPAARSDRSAVFYHAAGTRAPGRRRASARPGSAVTSITVS